MTVSFLGIHKWVPNIYIRFSPTFHLRCIHRLSIFFSDCERREYPIQHCFKNIVKQRVLNDIKRTRLSRRRIFGSSLPPLPSLSLSGDTQEDCKRGDNLLMVVGGGGRWGRSHIIRRWESLVSINLSIFSFVKSCTNRVQNIVCGSFCRFLPVQKSFYQFTLREKRLPTATGC